MCVQILARKRVWRRFQKKSFSSERAETDGGGGEVGESQIFLWDIEREDEEEKTFWNFWEWAENFVENLRKKFLLGKFNEKFE